MEKGKRRADGIMEKSKKIEGEEQRRKRLEHREKGELVK